MAIDDIKTDEIKDDELPYVLQDDEPAESAEAEGAAESAEAVVSQDEDGAPDVEAAPIDSAAHVDEAPDALVAHPEDTPVTERKEGDYAIADAAMENIGAVSEEGVHEEGPGEEAQPAVQPTGDAPELKAPIDEQPKTVEEAEHVADMAVEDAAQAPPAAADEPQKADAGPELSAPHHEAQAAVDAAPGPLDELRQAGNIVAPALKQLADHQDAIDRLEGEAHARLSHLRQKMTEALAALEAVFKYD